MRLVEGNSECPWKMDCRVWQKTHGPPLLQREGGSQSSDDSSTDEPPIEILACRGWAQSQEVRQRISTTNESHLHFERHWRCRGGPDAVGAHEDRIDSEISSHRRKKNRPDCNFACL